MHRETHIRTPASFNSAIMHWRVSSNYEWKHTAETGNNASVSVIVSTLHKQFRNI